MWGGLGRDRRGGDFLSGGGYLQGKWSKGGLTIISGYREIRPRNVPALASNCLNSDLGALSRHLQSMPSTHTV